MKQHDWTEQLRQRMDSFEEPVPADLWSGVELRVGRRGRIVALRRWLSAAAVVALLAGGGWMLLNWDTDHLEIAQNNVDKPVAAEPVERPQPAEPLPAESAPAVPRPTTKHSNLVASAITTAQPAAEPMTSEPEQTTDGEPATDEQSTAPPPREAEAPERVTPRHSDPPRPSTTKRRAPRVSLALNADNLLASADASRVEPVMMSPSAMGPLSSALARRAPVYLANSQEEATHRMPLTVGLSARLTLSPRWWAETGLNYSYAASTFTHRYSGFTTSTDQQLHYVGLPLSVGYNFWQSPSLRLYAAAGAEAMVNVSARISEGHISHDRLQTALSLSAGVDYELWPAVSIYLQPALRYYPDNGSPLQNAFKERPLQFDLRLGLRYTIGNK
ncbi:MAG: outer membrane beta-barrel protein [Prevotella sp.]|nr:outer membrane beta-barrel protein [Prevotella sp.]